MRPAALRTARLLGAMVALQVSFIAVRSLLIGNGISPLVERAAAWSIAAGIAVALVPERAIAGLRAGLESVERRPAAALRLVAAAAFAAALAAALTQQSFTWDEPFVFPAARLAADEGLRAFFARYASIPWLGTNHPPLAVLVYAAAIALFGPSLMVLRVLTALLGTATCVAAFAIAKRLVTHESALFGALLLLASPLFDRMASAAMNDIFITFFFTAAVLVALEIAQSTNRQAGRGALLGLLVGAGLLSKYTMLLVYPVIAAIVWLYGALIARRREWAAALAVSGAMFALWLACAWHLGVFERQSAFVQHAAGVTTRNLAGLAYALDAIFTKLPSGLGVYNLPLLAFGARDLARTGGRSARLLGAWIALVCAPLVVTLPDNRYFLPAYPALATALGVGLTRIDAPSRPRVLLLAWLLCATTLAYYAEVDLHLRAFFFRSLLTR